MNGKEFKEKDIIKLIYEKQEDKIDEILKKTDERLKENLYTIEIERISNNFEKVKELKELFNKIEDNYNMKITEYNKELYKQGFVDGVNLIFNCLLQK